MPTEGCCVPTRAHLGRLVMRAGMNPVAEGKLEGP